MVFISYSSVQPLRRHTTRDQKPDTQTSSPFHHDLDQLSKKQQHPFCSFINQLCGLKPDTQPNMFYSSLFHSHSNWQAGIRHQICIEDVFKMRPREGGERGGEREGQPCAKFYFIIFIAILKFESKELSILQLFWPMAKIYSFTVIRNKQTNYFLV